MNLQQITKATLRLKSGGISYRLNYKDFCPEGTAASLRFSHSFGMIRISLKVEGEKMDPFQEKILRGSLRHPKATRQQHGCE